MPFKFFRPWEDYGEASTSQARTHGQGTAVDAHELWKQPQVHSGWILQPEQTTDLSISSPTTILPAGSIKLASDINSHGDTTALELLHNLDGIWKRSCSTGPRSGGSGLTLQHLVSREDPSLANKSQIICMQESSLTFNLSNSSSVLSLLSNSATENDCCVNVTPEMTQKQKENIVTVKTTDGLRDAASLKKPLETNSGCILFKCKENDLEIAASSHIQMQELHIKSRPFTCKVCSKAFLRSNNLREHERTHTGCKPFQCEICGKVFTQSTNLRVHERTHTGSKPFKCRFCMKSFAQASNVSMHERIHTGSKPFKCTFCKKAFTASGQLLSHERIHTGSRPFKCNICEKTFTQSSTLRMHERIHTGCKPFKCETCDKVFAFPSCLQAHTRTHTGSKPFKCIACDKAFAESSNLQRHERMHARSKLIP